MPPSALSASQELTPPSRGFAEAEYYSRTEKAQALMIENSIDGLLLMTEPEVRYFTGFHTLFWQSPTRPWFVFVPVEGKPIAIIPEIGSALMRKGWLDDVRTWSAPSPNDDGISLLVQVLAPLATNKSRLGVMKGHETQLRMPLNDWERLLSSLPDIRVVDATNLVQGMRMVKSEAEIEKLAYITKVGSATFNSVPEFAHIGIPLETVFREFRRTALALGADDAPYLVGGASQGGYTDVISPPSTRSLQSGDILMMDTGCTWDGYFCDFDRNWAVGHASDKAKRVYDILWRATEAGIEAAIPGNACKDVFDAMASVISALDTSGGDVGRLGHGLGMQLTEQPSLAGFNNTVLKENMVLTIEPSLMYADGLMMVHEENIVVGETKARLLTARAPCELPVI